MNNEIFINGAAFHLVKKLAQTEKKTLTHHQKPDGEDCQQVVRMTELLEGLSVLCDYKGKPLKTNQRTLVPPFPTQVLQFFFYNRNNLEANIEED